MLIADRGSSILCSENFIQYFPISSFLAEMLLQTTVIPTSAAASLTSPIHSTLCHSHHCCFSDKNVTRISPFSSPKTFVLPRLGNMGNISRSNSRAIIPCATMLEAPVLWAGRLCIFYALLKAGLAGSPANPLSIDLESGADDFGFYDWFQALSKPEKEAAERRKLVSKWHPTTKGTLRRNYRVASKSEGRRLLRAIASLLSDDDQFRDATSHKGCQIRRENAHGESVCCNNVRALFDELPTPHLTVEITAFPSGPLTENDYAKAERLERVLRSGPSV